MTTTHPPAVPGTRYPLMGPRSPTGAAGLGCRWCWCMVRCPTTHRWRITPWLEPHRRVHAMDQRGRGGSGDDPGWSLEREVEDVIAVIETVAAESAALEAQPAWPTRVAAAPTLLRELSGPLSWDSAGQPGLPYPPWSSGRQPSLHAGRHPRRRAPELPARGHGGQQHVADQLVPADFAAHVLDFLCP